MVREHKLPNPFLDPSTSHNHAEEPDNVLALALQNASPGDQRLAEALIERYTAELLRLAQAMLEDRLKQEELSYRVCAVVEATLNDALAGRERFSGETSVRVWLYRLCLNQIRRQRWRKSLKLQPRGSPGWQVQPTRHQDTVDSDIWRMVAHLPERSRLVVFLRYVVGWNAARIAHLLSLSERQILHILSEIRRQRLETPESVWDPAPEHARCRTLLRGRLDVQLDHHDLVKSDHPQEHLSTCQNCQRYAANLANLEKNLAQSLKRRWPIPLVEPIHLARFKETVLSATEKPTLLSDLLPTLQRGFVVGAAFVLIVSLIWVVNQVSDRQYSRVFPPTATPTVLPPPQQIITAVRSPASPRQASDPAVVANFMPSLSGNGRWVVFAQVPIRQSRSYSQIMLFDRQRDAIEALKIDFPEGETPESIYLPLLSEDGQYLAFSAAFDSGSYVYLHDRKTGLSIQVDQTGSGGGNGKFSQLAALSANGDYVVFWSNDSDLLADPSSCQSEEGRSCFDIFIYNRQSGEIERLPIGRQDRLEIFNNASISADGRWIGFTLYRDDQISSRLELHHPSEAVLYNRQTGEFHFLNTAPDGTPGDSGSTRPVLSADGRYAAFTSSASNLVPGDTNQASDVFVRDLVSGDIERVSLTSQEEQASGDSGFLGGSESVWGTQIRLSADGRFVVFLSSAENLASPLPRGCTSFGLSSCVSIYLRDRYTGLTRRIANSDPQRVFYMPDISDDGRFVTYTELIEGCSPEAIRQVCAEVWLYDIEMDWTSPVSKGRIPLPQVQWNTRLRVTGYAGTVNALALTPLGSQLAFAHSSSSIHLWSIDDGAQEYLRHRNGRSLDEPKVTSLEYSPDGTFLASGRDDGTLDLWRLSDNTNLYSLDGHPGAIVDTAILPAARLLAVGTRQTITFWELRDNVYSQVQRLEYADQFLNDLTFSPTGEWLALATGNNAFWLMSVPSGEVVLRLGNLEKLATRVAFSPDGEYLAGGSADGSIHIWRLEQDSASKLNASYRLSLQLSAEVTGLSFSRDGTSLAAITGNGELGLWSVPDGQPLETPSMNGTNVSMGSLIAYNGDILAAVTGNGELNIYRARQLVIEPRLFTIASYENFRLPPASPAYPLPREAQAYRLSLYEADTRMGGALRAPVYLPPGILFSGAQLSQDAANAILHYQFSPGYGAPAQVDLYFYQHNLSAAGSQITLGASAVVEQVLLQDRTAEYVQGDWLPPDGKPGVSERMLPVPALVWDRRASTQWLRWRDGEVLLTLLARPRATDALGSTYLTRADLIDIAKSVSKVSEAGVTGKYWLDYTVKAGDTCSGIAERYGVTAGDIVRANQLSGNCELILAGQSLQVPLPRLRQAVAETDLDCDGQLERVQVIPSGLTVSATVPTSGQVSLLVTSTVTSTLALEEVDRVFWTGIEAPVFLGVVVDELSPAGFYQETWQLTIDDQDIRGLLTPQVVSYAACETYLALNLLEYTGGTRFQMYRWDGQLMQPLPSDSGIESPATIPFTWQISREEPTTSTNWFFFDNKTR